MSHEKVTIHVRNEQKESLPETATRISKKLGRPGNKIATAFKNIPSDPVNFEEFAKDHGVKTTVLRQIKRHDQYKHTGKVFVRKNKETGCRMIWREPKIN